MGSFSWNKADDLTAIENVACGYPFKFLIPKEFGGGFIKDVYQDYGRLGTKEDGTPKYDMYELQAFWNVPDKVQYSGEFPLMKEIDEYSSENRLIGVSIGYYKDEILKLKYPLKLVPLSFKGAYEDLEAPSFGCPEQGFRVIKKVKEVW